METTYDVVIIGAGPAGYVAAIRCAQLGLKTACVDARTAGDGKPALGGTCLNIGCIPSKALLESSEQFYRLGHQFSAHGISVEGAEIDVGVMQARKEKIVHDLTAGIAMLFKAHGIDSHHGTGRLLSDRRVAVIDPESQEMRTTLDGHHVILATGSAPVELPFLPFDGETVVDSTGALAFEKVPPRLGVIGAGVIGLELGSVWNRLGSEVTILEALEDFLPAADPMVAREALRQLRRQGLDIRLGAKVESAEKGETGLEVRYTAAGKEASVEVDKLVVAVGRKPWTEGLLAPDCGVDLDEGGFIVVDEECRTSVDNVWAVGDVVRGPMLAHKGSEEGVAVAERIAGLHAEVDFGIIPWVIYTSPEIAWVGSTETELKARGLPFRSGMFPFAANGRARAREEPGGFARVLAHAETDRLLGVHLIGPHASELIAEAVLCMEFQGGAEDIARTIHAHPTLSEALHEAALAVDKRALHKAG